MKITTGRKILIGFIACIVILFGISFFTFKNSKKIVTTNAMVDHTNQVLYEFEQILVSCLDAETSSRGFIITGNGGYLETFTNANTKVSEHLAKTKELTSDNLTQQKNIDELEHLLYKRINILNKGIDLAKSNFEKARALIALGEGKSVQDSIRKVIERAEGIEKGLLAERKRLSDTDAENFNLVFAVLLLIIVTILIIVYAIITRNFKAIKKAEAISADKNWLLTGNTQLNNKIQGEKEISAIAADVINELTTYLDAQIGAIYLAENDQLNLAGSYAFDHKKGNADVVKFGEGLVGQSALQNKPIIFNDIPDDYIKINSGLGEILPKHLLVFPFQYDGRLKGVVEIGAVKKFSQLDIQFINLVSENIGIAFNASQSRTRLKELLEKNQRQTEELQAQQEELRQMNEELEEQSQNLKQQQEELRVTNEELEEQAQSLEMKNKEIEEAKDDVEQKTKQLEVSSRYKSEFLANMSHELRTPLNSLLILSKDLADNKNKNLDADQVESAEIIYKCGHDLLLLINEVLDLSKIEAGKMPVNIESVSLRKLMDELIRDFKHHAEQKELTLTGKLDHELPEFIQTDLQRLSQILKNLLSNAIKFTEKGSININMSRYSEATVIISVSDTGIGIPDDKQLAIFEAFQQADGGTSRKYGGTGLGLSISRDLAKLLGAEIKLSSKPGEGAAFSLILPMEIHQGYEPVRPAQTKDVLLHHPRIANNNRYLNYTTISDDRDTIMRGDVVVLVIEDDLKFAAILLKQANQKGFKCIAAATGEDGLALAIKYKPQAIILDLDLPGINGHNVLAQLKTNPSVRHIPVHIVSVDERSLDPIKEGAIEYLVKPVSKKELEDAFTRIESFVSRKMKNLLIVEDDENSRKAMRKLIGNGDVKCMEAATGKDALEMYLQHHIDCIVLDIGLPDMSGFDLIYKMENIEGHTIPPIIIYTGKELTEENNELQKYAESIIIKGVRSEERLLDETALFLHRTISNLPESKQLIINNLYDRELVFNKKKILFADDDMRNVFALSKKLKERGMEIIKAENGAEALEMLHIHPDIDLVLMDIMMPEMDGYEATRQIRLQQKFSDLPVIALTAKAMKEDRQKCIDAGANDYITKPVDVERLLSLMRVWLSK